MRHDWGVLRQVLLTASRSTGVRRAVETAPVTRQVVRRFVAGETADDAVRVTRSLADDRLLVSLDHLGEDTTDRASADAMRESCIALLNRLASAGLTDSAEVSLKLSSLGQALPGDGNRIATDAAWKVCAAAAQFGTTVTLDMEDHTTTDSTLEVVRALRADFPWVGAVLQAYLRRTEGDCRDLAYAGSRVRLCKGAYNEPESVAFADRHAVDLSYVRCLRILMAGDGYPMVASHDPRLLEIAGTLAARNGRGSTNRSLQRYEAALTDFDQLIRFNPKFVTAYYNRALVYVDMKQPDDAMRDLTAAIGIDKDYAGAYAQRGLLHEKLAARELAIADFRAALAAPAKFASGAWAHRTARDRLKALGVEVP